MCILNAFLASVVKLTFDIFDILINLNNDDTKNQMSSLSKEFYNNISYNMYCLAFKILVLSRWDSDFTLCPF